MLIIDLNHSSVHYFCSECWWSCSPSDVMDKDILTRQMDEVLIFFFFFLGINLMKVLLVAVSA